MQIMYCMDKSVEKNYSKMKILVSDFCYHKHPNTLPSVNYPRLVISYWYYTNCLWFLRLCPHKTIMIIMGHCYWCCALMLELHDSMSYMQTGSYARQYTNVC